jgi:[acyl-carrier-protein] S-malonyltransferase
MARFAFLFPGQGSQYVGMGRDFFETSSLAKEVFARADEVLGYKISELCFSGPEEELRLTQNTQPALLAVSQVAFSLLGRDPWMAAGHSLGEYSALVAAGALRFEDALLLVHKRGKYMQDAVPVGVGAMAALVGSDHETVNSALARVESGVAEIANWNSQEQIVIAGHKQAVEEAVRLIRPPRSVMLPVSAPFHSSLMKNAEERLSVDLDRAEFRDLRFPIVTNVEARIIHSAEEACRALKLQVSRPVLWYSSMELLGREQADVFVEIGPGRVLSGLIKRIGRSWPRPPEVWNVENPETLARTQAALSGAP